MNVVKDPKGVVAAYNYGIEARFYGEGNISSYRGFVYGIEAREAEVFLR